jgi:hypothetical protein
MRKASFGEESMLNVNSETSVRGMMDNEKAKGW